MDLTIKLELYMGYGTMPMIKRQLLQTFVTKTTTESSEFRVHMHNLSNQKKNLSNQLEKVLIAYKPIYTSFLKQSSVKLFWFSAIFFF